MESVTNFSSQKNGQKNSKRTDSALRVFSIQAAILAGIVIAVLAWEGMNNAFLKAMQPALQGDRAFKMEQFPWPGTALLLSGKMDINQASLEELDLLPGIGEKGAAALLNFRMERGFLLTIDELGEAYGPFGSYRLDYLRTWLTVE